MSPVNGAPGRGELASCCHSTAIRSRVSWSRLLAPKLASVLIGIVPITARNPSSRIAVRRAVPASRSTSCRPIGSAIHSCSVESRLSGPARRGAATLMVWASGRSRELGPTPTTKSPASTTQRRCRIDQNAKARWSRSMLTCFESPAQSSTLAKPFNSRVGRLTVDSMSCT